jgi:hypothetical protein
LILLELSPVVSRHRVALSYPVLMHFGGNSDGNDAVEYGRSFAPTPSERRFVQAMSGLRMSADRAKGCVTV